MQSYKNYTQFPIQQNKNKSYPEDCNLQLCASEIVFIQKDFMKASFEKCRPKYTGKNSYNIIKTLTNPQASRIEMQSYESLCYPTPIYKKCPTHTQYWVFS